MTRLEVFLWPLVGFLAVAALASHWQGRRLGSEAAARSGSRRALVLAAIAAAILVYLLIGS